MSEPGRHIPETKQEKQSTMLPHTAGGLVLKGIYFLILVCTEAFRESLEVF